MMRLPVKHRQFTRYRVTEAWFRPGSNVERVMNRLLSDGMGHARYQHNPPGIKGHVLTVWTHKTEQELRALIREAEDKEAGR